MDLALRPIGTLERGYCVVYPCQEDLFPVADPHHAATWYGTIFLEGVSPGTLKRAASRFDFRILDNVTEDSFLIQLPESSLQAPKKDNEQWSYPLVIERGTRACIWSVTELVPPLLGKAWYHFQNLEDHKAVTRAIDALAEFLHPTRLGICLGLVPFAFIEVFPWHRIMRYCQTIHPKSFDGCPTQDDFDGLVRCLHNKNRSKLPSYLDLAFNALSEKAGSRPQKP